MTGLTLDSAGLALLLGEAAERASARRGRTAASVTVPVDCADPVALVFSSRLATEPWFCWEQPDRGVAIASLGQVETVTGSGPDRFLEVAAECAHLSGEAVVTDLVPEGSETAPLWIGGFAFADEGARESHWSSYESASMVLPAISFSGRGPDAAMTVNLMLDHGQDPTPAVAVSAARVAALTAGALPMLDPHPAQRPSIESSRTPDQFERSVSAAVSRIRSGEIEKVVLAREVVVRSGSAHDPAAVFAAIREGFPTCFNFCVGTPEAAFIGASPELLVRWQRQDGFDRGPCRLDPPQL